MVYATAPSSTGTSDANLFRPELAGKYEKVGNNVKSLQYAGRFWLYPVSY
jgi:hypothetical protein